MRAIRSLTHHGTHIRDLSYLYFRWDCLQGLWDEDIPAAQVRPLVPGRESGAAMQLDLPIIITE